MAARSSERLRRLLWAHARRRNRTDCKYAQIPRVLPLAGPSCSLLRDPLMDTRHVPCRPLKACSRNTAISRHSPASPRFCSSMVTPILWEFYRSRAVPICGANRSNTRRVGVPARREQPYSQLVLKIRSVTGARRRTARFASQERRRLEGAV